MRARTSLDTNSLAKAVQRPGIDPRKWIDKCVIEDVAVDPNRGVFADVKSLLDGDVYCAYVCGPSVSDEAGDYSPVALGDTVIVARPGGDQGNGAYVISRAWDQSDKPASSFHTDDGPATGKDPSPDRWIIMKPGTALHIRSSQGGDIDIQCDDAGDIKILVDTGKVYIGGDTGTEPPALATTLKTWLQSIRAAFNSHTHAYLPGPGPGTVPTAGPLAPWTAVPDIEADKVEVK